MNRLRSCIMSSHKVICKNIFGERINNSYQITNKLLEYTLLSNDRINMDKLRSEPLISN